MPTYHVEMMEGRTVEQKRKLVEEITRKILEKRGLLVPPAKPEETNGEAVKPEPAPTKSSRKQAAAAAAAE